METQAQKCTRLVAALEDLTNQESDCVRGRDFATIVSIQRRAAPLIEHLVVHGPAVADAALRGRIAAIIARREETAASISREVETTRRKLDALKDNQRVVWQIAPVYGRRTNVPRSRLRVVG